MSNFAMTGGATGIGAAIKLRLEQAGHKITVVDIKGADIQADLSLAQGRQAAIAELREHFAEGMDGFITCAGVASQAPAALTTSLNYYGTTELIDGVFDLIASVKGNVLLVSSNSAPMCDRPDYIDSLLEGSEESALKIAEEINGHQAYSGTKQAVARWMRRNISRFSAAGIRINAIAPGYTETPLTKGVAEDPVYGPKIREFLASIPIGRAGVPDDMAKATKFLMSEDASFITGAVLYIDGGHDALFRPDQI